MCRSGLTSEIDHTLDDTASILLKNGEDSGWFVDRDVPLSSLYSPNDETSRPHKGENEDETGFFILRRGRCKFEGK